MTVTYKTLDDPLGADGTIPRGINDNGQIVGFYIDSSGYVDDGFIYNTRTGKYKTLDDPLGTEGTDAFGINDNGQIVGGYMDGNGQRGFLSHRRQRRQAAGVAAAAQGKGTDKLPRMG